jgi:hypothetical protein
MSTWTSKPLRRPARRSALPAIALAALAWIAPNGATADVVRVAGGSVAISGPRGYCVDPKGTRSDATRGFVLLGSCAALSGSAFSAGPPNPAVLTASVLGSGFAGGEPIGAVLPEMALFFKSTPGRAALSRSGKAATVEVLEMTRDAETLFIRLKDTSAMAGASVEPEYWRAVLSVRGRIVTLSVLGLASRPLSSSAKRRTLDAFVERVRKVNTSA